MEHNYHIIKHNDDYQKIQQREVKLEDIKRLLCQLRPLLSCYIEVGSICPRGREFHGGGRNGERHFPMWYVYLVVDK